MSNEQVFAEFIRDQDAEYAKQGKAGAISTDWVLWMLSLLESARLTNATIDPQWLRASVLVGYALPQREDK